MRCNHARSQYTTDVNLNMHIIDAQVGGIEGWVVNRVDKDG